MYYTAPVSNSPPVEADILSGEYMVRLLVAYAGRDPDTRLETAKRRRGYRNTTQ